MNEDIANQERLLVNLREQSWTQLEGRKESLRLQIKNLEAASREWDAKALEASQKTAEYERIRQDVQRAQSLYERLLTAVQSVGVSKNLDQENIQVLERATEPRAFTPGKPRSLLLGLILGLGLGLCVLYVMDILDDKFASINELRNHLSEIVVGQVPDVHHKASKDPLALIQAQDERHVFVESFRNIRSLLLFTYSKEKHPRTILVTSSVPEEGKTTIASNLAITMALAGSRVLLIDADLRRALIHKQFEVPLKPGIAEIFRQKSSFSETIKPTPIANLSVITAGEMGGDPGELFLSPSADVFISQIQGKFNYVFMDSAPILATDDTSCLAPKLDGVLFVVRGSFTSTRIAHDALDTLRQRKVNILGLVYNRAMTSASEYYYYYRYSNYYYRRPEKDKQQRPGATGGTRVGRNGPPEKTDAAQTLDDSSRKTGAPAGADGEPLKKEV